VLYQYVFNNALEILTSISRQENEIKGIHLKKDELKLLLQLGVHGSHL
jgi:hypothetical protein